MLSLLAVPCGVILAPERPLLWACAARPLSSSDPDRTAVVDWRRWRDVVRIDGVEVTKLIRRSSIFLTGGRNFGTRSHCPPRPLPFSDAGTTCVIAGAGVPVARPPRLGPLPPREVAVTSSFPSLNANPPNK